MNSIFISKHIKNLDNVGTQSTSFDKLNISSGTLFFTLGIFVNIFLIPEITSIISSTSYGVPFDPFLP